MVAKLAEIFNKINKENASKKLNKKKLKERFATLVKQKIPVASTNIGPPPRRESKEEMLFGKGEERVDRMTIDPSVGSSICGTNRDQTETKRMSSDKHLEQVFLELVKQRLVSNKDEALEIAKKSGNQ